MENKKTILKELLEWIDSSEGRMLEDPWWEIQIKIQSLLSDEKKQIKNAFSQGEIEGYTEGEIFQHKRRFKDSEDYYNKIYKNI